VLVIDNASSDGSLAAIAQAFPEYRLLHSAENLGFARANNWGMKEAKGDVFVLLNSDTEVHDGALAALQEAFARDSSLAVAGGRLLNSDGSLQHGIRYDPRVSNCLSESLFLHHLLRGPCWCEVECRPSRYQAPCEAEWLSGAYLAVRRDWYERVGGLDAGFFMYSEDADWCYRIRKAGGVVRYLPESVVTHHGGSSSGGSARLLIYRAKARDRYARLHFSPRRAGCYRAALALGLVLRSVLFGLAAPFGQRFRDNARWRWQAVWELYSSPLPLEVNPE
jgi:GT2 family glycosyltransferase